MFVKAEEPVEEDYDDRGYERERYEY
jgi:hypothetical protein